MRYTRLLTLLSLLIALYFRAAVLAAPAPSQGAQPTSQPLIVRAVALSETPNVDGKLAERCWREIAPVGGFVNLADGSPAEPKTRFRVATAKRWLYIAVVCETEDIRRVEAFRRQRDSDVFHDDSFEALIDPLEADGRVYRFAINSVGTRMDEIIPSGGRGIAVGRPFWLGGARHDLPPNQNRWTAEIAIDLASLELSSDNPGAWRANFIRHARGFTRSDSAWAPARFWLFGCDRARMGTVLAVGRDGLAERCQLRVVRSDVRGESGLLVGQLAAEILNETPARRTLDVTLRTATRWMNTKQVTVAANSRATVEFPLEMSLAEEPEVKIEAPEPDTKNAAAAIAHRLSLPPPLRVWFDRSYYTRESSGSLQVEIARPAPAKQTLNLRLFNAETGRLVWQDAPAIPRSGGPSRLAARVALDDVPLGGYLMEAALDDLAVGQRYRVWRAMRRLPSQEGEVQVSGDGFLLRDGAPFFPIEVRRIEQPDSAILHELKTKAAFNVNWAWYLYFRGTENYVQNVNKATGLLGDLNVDHLYYAEGEVRDEHINRAKRVAALPCMFAYGMEELPGEDGYSTAPMQSVRTYLQSLAPNLAFYIVVSHPSQVERYRDCADFLAMRCRAIGPGNVGEPEWVWDQMRRACEQAGPALPIVAMISAYRDYERGLERPMPQQMRAIAYMALIGGAAGVVFDGYHYRGRTDPAKRGFSDDPALRDAIYTLTHEIAVLGSVLLLPNRPLETVAIEQPPRGSVRWTARGHGGKLYVIAVNGSAEKAYAAFRTAQRRESLEVSEIFEKRTVALDGTRFAVEFAPYGTHVFAITEKR